MSDTTLRRPIHWSTGFNTDTGLIREVNEDAVYSAPELGLWVVADGMGGHAVGDFASNKIVEVLQETSDYPLLSDMVDQLEARLLFANQEILDYGETALDNATIGSTVVSLLIRGQVGICLWAGDSRLYRFRNNELLQLSSDHSQVQEWIDQGLIKEEEAANHPHGNVITRAIGVDSDCFIDMNVFSTRIGDTYLLCSDGLHNIVDAQSISQCLAQADSQSSVDQLLALALEKGAPDNVSIVVVKGEPGKLNPHGKIVDEETV